MKKILLLILLMLLSVSMLLTSCNLNEDDEDEKDPPNTDTDTDTDKTVITMPYTFGDITLTVGESIPLPRVLKDGSANRTLTYTVSGSQAAVGGYVLTARAECAGGVTVSVSCEGYSAAFAVRINAAPDGDTSPQPQTPVRESFGKYSQGTLGVEGGYIYDESKSAYVTKAGTNGDSAFILKAGTPLMVDYFFNANVTVPDMKEGGAFYLSCKKGNSTVIRFGIEATSTSSFKIVSDYCQGSTTARGRITHKTVLGYTGAPIKLGVVAYGNSVAMLYQGKLIYKRTLSGIGDSELVVSGGGNMVAQIAGIQYEDDSARTETLYNMALGEYRDALFTSSQFPEKITEDRTAGTVTLSNKASNTDAPAIYPASGGNQISAPAFAIKGTVRMVIADGKSGHFNFATIADSDNSANIIVNRNLTGSNGVWRNIKLDGTRAPASGNEHISETLTAGADWTAKFAYTFYKGELCLYIKETGESWELVSRCKTDWVSAYPKLIAKQYVDATFSNLTMTMNESEVVDIINEVDLTKGKDTMKILFIGNSATSVNDVPNLLKRLAASAGKTVTVKAITKGGYTLAQHADETTDHGKGVYAEIAKGYDIVFLQGIL